jgi:hypothetical protein
MMRISQLLWATVFVGSIVNGAEPVQPSSETEGPAVSTSPAAELQRAPSESIVREDSPAARPTLPAARQASDRLELDTTVVTGNRELPKVLYIVPWKKADMGDLPGQPFNTLLDEVLTPVDRDVFRREVTYYGAVAERADATQSTSPARP